MKARKPSCNAKPKAPRKTKATSEGIAPAIFTEKSPAPKPAGYVFGRPTLYRPEMCEAVVEWGKQGKSKTWIAAELDITKETLYQWIKTYPDFSDAITRATVQCQRWWEDAGQNGLTSNVFNSTVWTKNMAARFRDEWTDRQEISGMDGAPLIPAIHVTTHSGSST